MLAAALSLSSSRIFSRTIVKSTTTTSSFFPRSAPRLAIRSMADSAAAAASAPFTKVRIQREDTAFDAYVVGKDNAPGIVVLQEWWGVDFEIKNHALKISQMDPGFKALIPDLYRGKVGLDVAEAQHLMDGLDWAGAVKDIRASANWLKANGSKKVDCVVAFYGVPSPELADPTKAKAPVQAHFGELDNFVGFSDVTAAKALEEKLKASGVPHEVHIYPGNGHAFMNTSPDGIKRRKSMGLEDDNEAAAELAWSRFKSWMSRYLHQ
ncbi:hypothetical protein BT93_L4671 [Corymbia citriodora subsp. variegata]|uniref:Dienelactone hydrolase domain-containing protein n=1 Tax=Corymbia citriodora subsp. variegata TaxID=360336 RepID=A0A8T0CTU8_CORYI|nr:hypothetical protein BT93_L4671 [Corymbia citriodora subsp. variegata]